MKNMPDDYWREKLTSEQYEVLRNKGTEPPFRNEFVDHAAAGVYACAACGTELFSSDQKYDSGTGWPSFTEVLDAGKIDLIKDMSHGLDRIEVVCKTCGGHLGHLFDDPRTATGKDYCVNSCALHFTPKV